VFGDTRLFASAYLQTAGRVASYSDSTDFDSEFETGVVTFQEMCEADADNPTCGVDNEPCDGTCVTGAFFGLPYDDKITDPPNLSGFNYHGLHIHEFSPPNPSLPSGCQAAGDIWNPEGLTVHHCVDEDICTINPDATKAGTLSNVLNVGG
jgi:Cu/Zn superoxide dismutase